MDKAKTISKDAFKEFIDRLLENFQVIAPVRREGKVFYDLVSHPYEVMIEYKGHTLLPPKRFFFPEKEILFTYELVNDEVIIYDKCEELEGLKRVLIGVRACDIKGLEYLDKVFIGEYHNPYYKVRRENTLIIGLTCNEPMDYCFCAHTGSGPRIESGYDLLLTDLGDYYLVDVGSEEGEKILKYNIDIFKDASEEDLQAKEKILSNVEARIRENPFPDLDKMYDSLIKNFNAELWEKYGERCLACGKCNFVCPTCRCFDIYDDPNLDLKSGRRIMVWDSCHFLSFTRVAGGLVFRKERPSRIKQRVYHKYCYSIDEIGSISCTGCGRCIDVCPASIDIREIVREVVKL